MAFYNMEPFGGDTQFYGSAIVASTVANVNRGKNKPAYKTTDFMPKFKKSAQTTEEMMQFAEMMTIGLGGNDNRSK